MPRSRICPHCGASVPANAPDGFCPRCSLAGAITVRPEPIARPAANEFADYELLEEIGRGGMGVVFRARQKSLERLVAVKMLLHGRFSDPAFLRRFRVEAEAAAHLEHPNIVSVYEIGEYEGQPYYAMRLVEGHGLDREVDLGGKGRPMAPARAARLMATIARAVHHAHQHGVLHRDLKPHNVLLDAAGEPHLTDFGLAKLFESAEAVSLTEPGTVFGSPAFMAPEQASGAAGAITTAADIYSLGAMLYALLVGRPPFAGSTSLETLHRVIAEEPPKPRALNPAVPRDLETICLKCLRKTPAQRYGSAEALAEDLERWARCQPIAARRVRMIERGWLWCRRQPVRAALTTALIAAVLAGAGGILDQWHRATHERRRAERAGELALREQYTARLALAQNLIEQSQFSRAQHVLAEAGPEALRGWEWGWLMRACHRDLMTLTGSGHGLTSVAFSPDGRWVATGCLDGSARIWNVDHGADSHALRGHTALTMVGNFSPDGRRLVTASWDKTVKIWDVAAGAVLRTLAGHEDFVYSAQFSPDGRTIASGGKDGTVRLWDATTGELQGIVARYDDGSVMSVAWSGDGKRLAFAGGSGLPEVTRPASVGLLDVETRSVRILRGHTATIPTVVFSPDSQTIATASWDGTARVAAVASGSELRPVCTTPAGLLFSVAFSPDGKYLAIVGSNRSTGPCINVVDAASDRLVQSLEGHSQLVRAVAFSPDGTRFATCSFDGTAKLWAFPPSPDRLYLEGHDQAVWAVTVSPDGKLVGTGGLDQTAKIWELSSGRLRATIRVDFPVVSLAFLAGGKELITNGPGNTARVWILPGAKPTEVSERLVLRGHDGVVMAVAADPRGRWLATGAKDGTARIWDARDGACVRVIKAHDDWVTCVGFNHDGTRLVTASSDRTAAVWEVATGRREAVLRGHDGPVLRVVFSPDGKRILTGGADATARIWDAASGAAIGAPLRGHTDAVGGVAWSPDGERIVTTGAGVSLHTAAGRDRTANLWDARTGRWLLRFRPHENQTLTAAFAPDGRSLVTGSTDNTANVSIAFPWTATDYGSDQKLGTEDRIEAFKRRSVKDAGVADLRPDRRIDSRMVGEFNVAPSAARKTRPAQPISPRPKDRSNDQIDLTPCYNAALGEVWQPLENLWRIDADLAALAPGALVHDGTRFDARGIVQLCSDGDDWTTFPSSVRVPIGRRFDRLNVIHGAVAAWIKETEGRLVGAYRLHYVDGSDATCGIQYGKSLRAFWLASDPQRDCSNANIAWQWQSPFPDRTGELPDARRIYHAMFQNPRPQVLVDYIEFESTGTHVAPFLVAMTVE